MEKGGAPSAASRREDRYVRVAGVLWAGMIVVFIGVVAGLLHVLREESAAATAARVVDDRVTALRVWEALGAYERHYQALPFPSDAAEPADRFLSEVESMMVLRALTGAEARLNPGRDVFLDLPLVSPEGRLVDEHHRQMAMKFDFNGDGRVRHRGLEYRSRFLVMACGPNGRPDTDPASPADDLVAPDARIQD